MDPPTHEARSIRFPSCPRPCKQSLAWRSILRQRRIPPHLCRFRLAYMHFLAPLLGLLWAAVASTRSSQSFRDSVWCLLRMPKSAQQLISHGCEEGHSRCPGALYFLLLIEHGAIQRVERPLFWHSFDIVVYSSRCQLRPFHKPACKGDTDAHPSHRGGSNKSEIGLSSI